MARRFSDLDDEQRALHGSWRDMGRVFTFAVLTAVVVWGAASALALAVHGSSDALFERVVEHPGWSSFAILLGALALAGVVRGVLHRFPSWRAAEHDGIELALGNYHVTYGDDVDDPGPRYARPSFGIAIRKLFATIVTLGSGGSGGLEGPVVLIGESTGAGIARWIARSEHELRTYQLVGIAAAVATLLGAPFTAALFALELAYNDRIIYRKLAYAFLAVIIAYALNQSVTHHEPLFVVARHARDYSVQEYMMSVLVAVAVSAPLALAFGLTLRHTRNLTERVPPLLRGPSGALGCGVVALALYVALGMDIRHVLGMGDHTLDLLLAAEVDPQLQRWWFLLAIVGAKMLATGLTVQSGGSAGMLIPSMAMGGVAGATVAFGLDDAGLLAGVDPRLFVVVGVSSALVAMVGVPMSAVALVLEVFGASYGPAAVLATGVTYVLTLRLSVYGEQRREGLARASADAASPDAASEPAQTP